VIDVAGKMAAQPDGAEHQNAAAPVSLNNERFDDL
jgi:hypothetical protein